MSWTPLGDRLPHLPLVLAGPILRRTESDSVTVWLALQKSCEVRLSVYETVAGDGVQVKEDSADGDGRSLLLAGTRSTVSLGQNLHIVAVTARAIVAGQILVPGQVYVYDLHFSHGEREWTLQQALNAASFPALSVSYFNHQLPSFSLPPTDLDQLRILHGSCRKAHGGEADILPFIDTLIEQHCTQANTRPHQLFFTGDQIYGDDVADPLLMALTDAGDTLLGWEEELPIDASTLAKLKYLQPGQRSQVAEEFGGFTAGLQGKQKLAKSHLFGLGEYCASYLFVWSQVLWMEFPEGRTIHHQRKAAKAWDQEVKALEDLAHTLWRVRRLLANVPTYMIFDDHDISDDWYLNREWCERVLSRGLGRRTVYNGLLSYALFQGWGNTPEQFEAEQPGAALLRAAENWSISRGTDPTIEATIARYLGLPDNDRTTGLPKFKQDGKMLILDRHPSALAWSYIVRGSQHEVVVLDTRTWRGYPMDEATEAPPMLLSETAFDRQLRQPLQQTEQWNQQHQTTIQATLVIAPTNLVSLKAIDWIQHWNLRQGKVFHNDVGDAWNINKYAFSRLLRTLFEQRDRVVILSGDIHYGSAVSLHYWSRQVSEPDFTEAARVLAQLTSSASKNTEFKTRIVHTKVKSLVPEWSQDWAGWDTPPDLLEVQSVLGFRQISPLSQPTHTPTVRRLHRLPGKLRFAWNIAVSHPRDLPDWRYHVEWISRQPAQIVHERLKLAPQPRRGFKQVYDWLQFLWNNRWLQEGKEVVGLNNIGLVRFDWAAGTGQCAVTQNLYWYAPWRSGAVVCSQFRVPLDLKAPPVLIPVVKEKRK